MALRKLALFPATKNTCAVARFASSLADYELVELFAPSFLRLDGLDVAQVDGGPSAQFAISDFSLEKLLGCDVIYIEYDVCLSDLEVYQDIVSHAENMGKEVVLSHQLSQKLYRLTFETVPINEEMLYDIPVPVIALLPHGLYTGQFAMELALRRHFSDRGHKVAQIGSCEAASFFGFETIPSFMHSSCDAYYKTIAFNHYVREMVRTTKPDLLIIASHDPIMRYSNKVLSGLGVQPYIMCNAVRPDAAIVSLHHGTYAKDFLESVSHYCHYHLGCPAKYFNISNVFSSPDPENDSKLDYLTVESTFTLNNIRQEMEQDGIVLFTALIEGSAAHAYAMLESELEENIQTL